MPENFTPPGEGWLEGQPPPKVELPTEYEVVNYWDGRQRRHWYRRIMPVLPTEPGSVIRFTDAYGDGMAFLHPDGRWYSGEAGSFTDKGLRNLRSVEVVTQPPSDEYRKQVAEEIRAALFARFTTGYGATRTMIKQTIDQYIRKELT